MNTSNHKQIFRIFGKYINNYFIVYFSHLTVESKKYDVKEAYMGFKKLSDVSTLQATCSWQSLQCCTIQSMAKENHCIRNHIPESSSVLVDMLIMC